MTNGPLDVDVARRSDVVMGHYGRVDVVVNNIGDYRPMVALRNRRRRVGSGYATSIFATSSRSPGRSSRR
ncbi:hypothetical protein [Mycolicibacterium sarraceniae]|uniref:hypothetical protein n=1 Tax=Mycolicibacterium sarraceniae TaxID=1534348 RepID=UPI001F427399|nr:hypothetical protein [Mycolicibacterium sarraceniae]